MKGFYQWYRKHITGAIFAGLILGILTGLFLADKFEVVLTATSALGSIYMNALNMMIFPLVFCSIVMGIASIGSAKTTGKITGAAMLFFLCTTALASFMGLIIPRLIHLGRGVKFEMATSDIQATKMDSILDTVKGLIPMVLMLGSVLISFYSPWATAYQWVNSPREEWMTWKCGSVTFKF